MKLSLYGSFAAAVFSAVLLFPRLALAHCDTMDGPVIRSAQTALERKDVTPVLKWVKPEAEAEVKSAFAKTLAVRKQSPEARELADRFFFETLVRVHRAGEGAPYTGLKPAGTSVSPALAAADQALENGSVNRTVDLVTTDASAGIRQRFAAVLEKQRHANDSVQAGREFVAAYVDYVHYVEGLHQAAQGATAHHDGAAETLAHETHTETAPQHHH